MELETKLKLEEITGENNLAELFSEDDLTAIAQEICAGYELDKKSRENWEQNIDEWVDLAMLAVEEKTFPWPNAANVKYPLVTTAALQFSSRAYPALLPGTNIVRGKIVGFDPKGEKEKQAVRIGKHMSYQLLDQMEDWEEEMDRLLFALPIMGCMFKKTYYSPVKGTNISEIVYPKELVVNYWSKTLEESPRITHVLRLSENDVHERVVGGLYLDVDLSVSPEALEERTSDSNIGNNKPEEVDDTLPFKILEQHTLLDLDGDGYKEPYVVTVDFGSRQVVRIIPRYDENSITFNAKNEIVRIKANNFFTKYSFIPSPDGGFYDIGFGVLLGPINDTINTLINQLLDSGSLSNMQSGFISKGIRIKGGNKPFTLGEWKYVNTPGDDLRKGLVPLPVREPSQVLFSLLGMMIESGEKLSSVTEVMTGQIPGQNTKATVAMAAIEQGMKVFSSIYKRIHRSLTKEFKKIFILNSIFLEDEEYFNALDPGEEIAITTGRADYDISKVDIIPTSDPNVATEQQRLAKAQGLMEVSSLGLNMTEVKTRLLEAMEQPNIPALLEVPPPQPPPEVQLEREKFEWQREKEERELRIREVEGRAKALEFMAKAESAEEGRQFEQYANDLGALEDLIEREDARDRAQEEHQQKMRQREEDHLQKMSGNAATQRQKLANMRGNNNGSDQGTV